MRDAKSYRFGRIIRRKRNAVVLAFLLVATGILLIVFMRDDARARAAVGATTVTSSTAPVTQQTVDPVVARGLSVYATNCSICHGATGLGDGLAAYLVYPKPRNFAEGQFRLTSTRSGLPSDEDILRTLRRGMPGSAMPSWANLPETDLQALVRAVRYLAVEGKVGVLMSKEKTMTRAKAMKIVDSVFATGAPTTLPTRPPDEQLDLKHGAMLYATNCASCHGADGRGRDKKDLMDSSGFPVFARDFTQGIFKGGGNIENIAMRITRGMPGSPMPGNTLESKDLWDLAGYVRSLAKPDAQQRVEQKLQSLVAHRSARGTLGLDDPSWQKVEGVFVPLMPLWWRDDRIEGVVVRALHNDSNLAIELTWEDATVNDMVLKPQTFTDGTAMQLAEAQNPPLFAMGSSTALVNIWHWKASWQHDVTKGFTTMVKGYPNMPQNPGNSGSPQDAVFQTATAAGNQMAQIEHQSAFQSLLARGIGTVTPRPAKSQTVSGDAQRTEKGWRVLFAHPLGPAHDEEIALQPDGTISIGFAVWDGEARDRNGQKSVTIWHRLTLEK